MKIPEKDLLNFINTLSEEKLRDLCFHLLYENIEQENGYNWSLDDNDNFYVYNENTGDRV